MLKFREYVERRKKLESMPEALPETDFSKYLTQKKAAEWYNTASEVMDSFFEDYDPENSTYSSADSIRHYQNQLTPSLERLSENYQYAEKFAAQLPDEEEKNSYTQMLQKMKKALDAIPGNLDQEATYWSQWDSQEEYDAAVKASRETQMTSSQIRQEIEEVTRQLKEEEAKENEQPTTRITNLWRPFINDEVKDDLKSDRIKELEAERDRLDSLYQQKKQYEASIPEKLREEHILAQKKGVPIIYALKPAEKIDTFIGQDGTEFTIDISKMLQEAVAGVSQAGETGEPAPTAFKELRFVLRENGYDYYRANGTGQLYRFRYNEDDDKDEFQLMMGLRTTQGVDPLVFKKAEEEGSGPSSDDPFEEYVYYQNRRVKQADYAKAAHELYQSPFFRYSNAIGKAIDDVNQLVPNAVKGIQKVYENSPFAPTDKEKEEPPKDLLAALNAAKEAPERM